MPEEHRVVGSIPTLTTIPSNSALKTPPSANPNPPSQKEGMNNNNAGHAFLQQLYQLPPESLQSWLTAQTPAQRQLVLQHLEAQQNTLSQQRWHLSRRRRTIGSQTNHAAITIQRLEIIHQLVTSEFTRAFNTIYTNGPAALQSFWQTARHSLPDAAHILRLTPRQFGALQGLSLLGLPSPSRARALRTARELPLETLWSLYHQVSALQVQFKTTLTEIAHVDRS